MQIVLTPEGKRAIYRLQAIHLLQKQIITVEEAQGRYLAAGGKARDFRRHVAAMRRASN